MSQKYKVDLQEVHDRWELDGPLLLLIDALIKLMNSNVDWFIDPREFIFRTVNAFQFGEVHPFGFSASDVLSRRLGVRRALTKDEQTLCSLLQQIIDACKDRDEVDKVRGTVFERYMNQSKTKVHGQTYFNANVVVNSVIVDNDGYKTADIGVDLLDSKEWLELAECSVTVAGFEKKMHRQFGFYTKAFEQIRIAVGQSAKLSFSLLAAHSGHRRDWSNVILDTKTLKTNSVRVRGCRLLENTDDDLI